ncbi:MAG TPA: hypothetical protein DCL61_12060, partial [Cyanobacteria bacterium UBA12227]|nr:hypothetical protein [Cyanobacteria bacterium UBA12227]
KGEIDTLTGGDGRDRFWLGTSTALFYDDDNSSSSGNSDYALITDFETRQDKIQLRGEAEDYILKTSPISVGSSTKDIGIYFDKSSSQPDELIAIVQDVSSLNLSSSYFVFV